MRKLQGNTGAIFDVAEPDKAEMDHYIQEFDLESNPKGFPIELATEIPELEGENTFTTSNSGPNFSKNKYIPSDIHKNKDKLEIFVGGLPFNMEEQEFTNHFKKFNVEFFTIRMLRDGESSKFKGAIFALCKTE